MRYDFQNLLTPLAQFPSKAVTILIPLKNRGENGTFVLFENSVNDNVTFAYIMTFHCTSVYLFASLYLISHSACNIFQWSLSTSTSANSPAT